jgi:hypothetical protein
LQIFELIFQAMAVLKKIDLGFCASISQTFNSAELLPQKSHGKLDPAPGRFQQFPSPANCLEAPRGARH